MAAELDSEQTTVHIYICPAVNQNFEKTMTICRAFSVFKTVTTVAAVY